MKRWSMALLLLFAACTPGGIFSSTGASGVPGSQVVKIDVNLTLHGSSIMNLPAGTAAGYAPAQTFVPVGSSVQFVNSDGFAHTATAIPGASTFPASSPFSVSAQQQSGTMISSSWSSGTLQAGQSSQIIQIDTAGTYLYGCFFHYGAPMRGEIVAQ
jgi:plastocyanin